VGGPDDPGDCDDDSVQPWEYEQLVVSAIVDYRNADIDSALARYKRVAPELFLEEPTVVYSYGNIVNAVNVAWLYSASRRPHPMR